MKKKEKLKNFFAQVFLSPLFKYEVPGPVFFTGPNSHSAYPYNIKFQNSRKTQYKRLAPHSRFVASIVDEKLKIVLFYSYKVGSSTIKKFIKANMQGAFPKTDFNFDNPQDISFPSVTNVHAFRDPGKHLITTIDWEKFKDYKKVLFMRDPLDKLVSFYIMVFIRGSWNYLDTSLFRSAYVLKTMGYFVKENGKDPVDVYDVSFEEFLFMLKEYYDEGIKLWDSHLSLQITPDIDLIAANEIEYYNVKQLDDFLVSWAKMHGIEEGLNTEGRNINKLKKKENIKEAYKMNIRDFKKLGFTPGYRSFYSPELEKIAKEIYRPDFQYWNRCDKNQIKDIFKA